MSTAGPWLTAAGLWQKEGKKATDSKNSETSAAPATSLVRTSPHHCPFKVGSPNTNSPLPITKVLALGSPSAASRSERDYPQHQVRTATALCSHPAAGPSREARGVHEDHFGARGASEAQLQSGLPGQEDSSHRSRTAGCVGGKRSWQLPSVSHPHVMWMGSKTSCS